MISEAEEEIVHGTVPITSELIPRGTVPPIRIETAVGKESELGENIELDSMVSYLLSLSKRAGRHRPRSPTGPNSAQNEVI